MKSATHHFTVIAGKPRTGKTTELVQLAEAASASTEHQVAFLFLDTPVIAQLPVKCLLIQYGHEQCPIQGFLTAGGDRIKNFTHVFIDDMVSLHMPSLLRFAQSFPNTNLTVVMN